MGPGNRITTTLPPPGGGVPPPAPRTSLSSPSRLYQRDPLWVPRLWPEQQDWLTRRQGFFDHGDGEWFLARRGGDVVGTIGVAIGPRENGLLGGGWGVFGFLGCIEKRHVF